MAFSLAAYLDRLGLSDVPDGAAGVLTVQEAQMRQVPFENLSPLLGGLPDLSPEALFDKLIHRRRGGYCFEQNGLLRLALEALGYAPVPLLARVNGGARTHFALAVETEGARYLVDAGFGGHGALRPIRLDDPAPQRAPNGVFRLADTGAETVLELQVRDTWVAQYSLDFVPVRPVDIEAANVVTARWEKAPFAQNLMLALHAPGGRVAMFNRAMTRGLPPDTTGHVIESEAELARVLREDFTLDLSGDEARAVWTRIADRPLTR